MILVPIVAIGLIMAFMSGAFPRKVKCLKKHFALIPQKIEGSWIWGKTYFSYHTYGHGMVLGGTVKAHYSKDGKKVSYSSRGASFFPRYKREWEGLHLVSLRTHLRSDRFYKSKYRERLDKIKNLEGINDFLYEGKNKKILKDIEKLKGQK